MAAMIPDEPGEIEKNSLEDIMFLALSKLPDEYYIFHSFKIVNVVDNTLHESETDFVIFNAKKGIICLEAKAGHVYFESGDWYYGSGIKMKHGGPYRQAANNKWKLKKYIDDCNINELDALSDHCKFLHAVWFPSISMDDLKRIDMPSEVDGKITLTSEALLEPQKYIDKLYEIKVWENDVNTELTNSQTQLLLSHVLCPSFHLVQSLKSNFDTKKIIFNRLLEEQERLLDYLEEQPSAVINGPAGSGKTMIAIEQAKRYAAKGEKVLFLCFNRYLKDSLKDHYDLDNVDFYTIDGLACKLCDSSSADLNMLDEKLLDLFAEGKFPYKHILIDEGQDFGQDDIEESNVIATLEGIVLDDSINGTILIFYDKLQLIQGNRIPSYIANADCKLSLIKNCRNTENIAVTSMRPFPEIKKPKIFEGTVNGASPKLYIEEDENVIISTLNNILENYRKQKINDVVILTCKTESTSILSDYIKNDYYISDGKKYRFTTCRKFKGLEADAVILVDIDKKVLTTDAKNVFYVGTSRARFDLIMFANLNDVECADILSAYGKNASSKRQKKALAAFLNAKFVLPETA